MRKVLCIHSPKGFNPTHLSSGQAWKIMRLITIFLFAACMQVCAKGYTQTVSLQERNAKLEDVFHLLKKQTGLPVLYTRSMLKNSKPVTVNLKNVSLQQALNEILKDQGLDYSIVSNTIVIKVKEASSSKQTIPNEKVETIIDVNGRVTDSEGSPLVGASVKVKGTTNGTTTDASGVFLLKGVDENAILLFSYAEHESVELKLGGRTNVTVVLKSSEAELKEVVINKGYYTEKQKYSVSSVGRVTSKEIERQPVSNPLATLIGRVPGLVVSQQSGVPGSSFNVQIRGRNSIAQGSQPLILIDGIPFAAGNENMQLINSAINNTLQGSGLSPFNALSPNDIESIEVLKDADATAIYGSRGANGVLLITTKKSRIGKTRVTANFNSGMAKVGNLLPLMNTQQYIAMRNEALANAGTPASTSNAPDLLVYDQTRYKDYQKEFLGGIGHVTNAGLSISGGNISTQFLLSGNYYRETSIFPNDLPNQRGSLLTNLSHKSTDNKLSINFSGGFTSVENRSASSDLTLYTFMSPNSPDFFDTNGKLQYVYNGVQFENPYSYLREKYKVRTNNLTSNLTLAYTIWKTLTAKVLMGYNQQFTDEQKLSPADAKTPTSTIQGHSGLFGKNQYNSWNIEPQLEYSTNLWKGKFSVLLGTTFLSKVNSSTSIDAQGFSSEALLESLDAATLIDATSTLTKYRYQAAFGRLNYNIADKYIVNATGRRDGSSRFGPGKQFSNFGAIGAAWIFSEEKFISNKFNFLSFGKLRGSYGVTGNDQIGDYQFVETWRPASFSYVNDPTLVPNNLSNPDYAWERNNKLEAGLDLGFLKDRIVLAASYYRNRSGNQLINYRLPYITGFSSVITNFPAVVQNQGWEFLLETTPIQSKKLRWNSVFNLTVPKNTLLSFPNINTSTYRSLYVVGQSLNSIYLYRSLGVDPTTGQISYVDVNGNNAVDIEDRQINGRTDPRFYGGWQNTLTYAGIELQCFFDFKSQTGRNPYYFLYGLILPAGSQKNQPLLIDDRWRKPGDVSDLPRITSAFPGTIGSNRSQSSFVYSDQSFIRLRNVSLAYTFPKNLLTKIGATSARVYMQGQNLMTFNRTKGYDPETQNILVMPTLQSYSVGIQITY
ncbi:TonB-linked SusC/RagA family outer membrane protein [Lacibacter cauensis]|uniref:TonB-linked SusC/RagA family outer membrane protein n=1 Tax=Lacibacter cauensis TaxID=510947 RepID=A0A562SX79_9BACT|nr:SusC/RagA family TonB-linked outer membrane protein [Lacibacter cauensis]TWI85851.1 TonB-linked SusC/RagA family outer membrane protein [Lacibacter cauensis]